jgi:hypothetical protein
MSDRLARYTTRAPVGKVDRKSGIIYGASIITKGEAETHDKFVDETMLDQVCAAAQGKESIGLKCRFDHTNACSRSMGWFVGRFHNARRDNGQVRGDLHISDSAAKSPHGDLREYVLDLAEDDPDAFATSIVFREAKPEIPDRDQMGEDGMPGEDDPYWFPHVRLAKLNGCDVVDEGAANEGLFGRPEYWAEQVERWAKEHPDIFDTVLDQYFERKQGGSEMSGTDGKGKKSGDADVKLSPEVQIIVDNALAAQTGAETALAEGKTQFDAAVKEAEGNGRKTMLERVKTRFAANEDAAFTIATIEDEDAEYQTAYTAHLKTALSKAREDQKKRAAGGEGAEAAEFSEDEPGGGKGATAAQFEAQVKDAMEADAKLSKAQAQRKVQEENPVAYEAYVKSKNAARKG